MRQNLVAGNWKMNLTYPEALALVSEITTLANAATAGAASPEIVICPPFPLLHGVGQALPKGGKFHLGAQNCHQKESGAFTGEVSAKLLASVGCEYVILGHSERRQYFREDDELLSQKLKAALAAGLKPIFCVGESLDTPRTSGRCACVMDDPRFDVNHSGCTMHVGVSWGDPT